MQQNCVDECLEIIQDSGSGVPIAPVIVGGAGVVGLASILGGHQTVSHSVPLSDSAILFPVAVLGTLALIYSRKIKKN